MKNIILFLLMVFCSTPTSLPATLDLQLAKTIYFCINTPFYFNINDFFPLFGINEYSSLEKLRLL